MKVGIEMLFQSCDYGPDMTDGRVVDEEIELGVLADQLGRRADFVAPTTSRTAASFSQAAH